MNTLSPAGYALATLLAGSLLAAPLKADNTITPVTTEVSVTDFRTPPNPARPRVWWHWMNGNVTLDGIQQDIAWMEKTGLGGLQYFDAAIDTPQVVDERVVFGSEQWNTAMRTALDEARKADLELTIASSPGFSETGGPWVKPEAAMKKLVWSELDIDSVSTFNGRLPHPPTTTGPFQDIPVGGPKLSEGHNEQLPHFYRDIAVIAYRIPNAERDVAPVISASAPIDTSRLQDRDRTHAVQLPIPEGGEGWVLFNYQRPHTVRAVELVVEAAPRLGPVERGWPVGRIEASDDGKNFRTLIALPERGAPQQTLALPETRAQYFRLVLEPRFAPFPVAMFDRPSTVAAHGLMEIRLLSGARVDRFEDKAGWSHEAIRSPATWPSIAADATIDRKTVIDLSPHLKKDGTLEWQPPQGRWRILRFGWTLTGKQVHPASPEATGLEVDKLDREHVSTYLDNYLRHFEKAVGKSGLGDGGIAFMLNDSYEAGAANWTDDMIEEFAQRRGYDPRPWLPVLAGGVIDSVAASEKFLWDFRRTLADLIADEHYDEISRRLQERGMGRYGESHEAPRAFIGDGMEVKKSATIPMGAYWASPSQEHWIPDLLESASVAHLYGQNLVAAESFTALTAPYIFTPEHLKPYANKMMINGVNRFVIHTSAHQPRGEPGPGLGLSAFGQYFSRNETWAELAKPWIDYLARSSYLLQQGRFSADIAWFYGEDENITSRYLRDKPDVPAGFRYDFVNADALRNLLRSESGVLSAPSGARYRILVIDPLVQRMTTATLHALLAHAKAGLPIVGQRPAGTPSLAENPEEFQGLADELWGGTYKVYESIEQALAAIKLEPDVDFAATKGARFVHRTLDNTDIYFVANLSDNPLSLEPSFRVSGRTAEIWHAESGAICKAMQSTAQGRTRVSLSLPPHQGVFVVFRENPSPDVRPPHQSVVRSEHTIENKWKVSFPEDHGAPPFIEVNELRSLSEHENPGVRYFSGIAQYETTFTVTEDHLRTDNLMLDLGAVKNVAEVRLNGRNAGIAWHPPFRLDISKLVQAGHNKLEIRVANLWPNRLIGDKQADAGEPVAFTTYNPYRPVSKLLESGLLGPVKLLAVEGEPCEAQ